MRLAAGGGETKSAFEAMMTMKKIDIAAIEAARRGRRKHEDTSLLALDYGRHGS
jgi:hypothetical protein